MSMSGWSALWHLEFLDNELGEWTVALAIFLVTFTVLPIAKRVISARRRREFPASPAYNALDLLAALAEHTSRLFLWGVAVWLAARAPSLPHKIYRRAHFALVPLHA